LCQTILHNVYSNGSLGVSHPSEDKLYASPLEFLEFSLLDHGRLVHLIAYVQSLKNNDFIVRVHYINAY